MRSLCRARSWTICCRDVNCVRVYMKTLNCKIQLCFYFFCSKQFFSSLLWFEISFVVIQKLAWDSCTQWNCKWHISRRCKNCFIVILSSGFIDIQRSNVLFVDFMMFFFVVQSNRCCKMENKSIHFKRINLKHINMSWRFESIKNE